MFMLWLNLGTKPTWLGLAKHNFLDKKMCYVHLKQGCKLPRSHIKSIQWYHAFKGINAAVSCQDIQRILT